MHVLDAVQTEEGFFQLTEEGTDATQFELVGGAPPKKGMLLFGQCTRRIEFQPTIMASCIIALIIKILQKTA